MTKEDRETLAAHLMAEKHRCDVDGTIYANEQLSGTMVYDIELQGLTEEEVRQCANLIKRLRAPKTFDNNVLQLFSKV